MLRHLGNYLLGQNVPDLNSGLRLVRRSTLMRYMHLMPDGFSFSTTSTFAMHKTGRLVRYVRITARPRVGTSDVRQVRHGLGVVLLMLRLTVLFQPLKVHHGTDLIGFFCETAVSGWVPILGCDYQIIIIHDSVDDRDDLIAAIDG